jgi:hypothetical protein
MVATQVPRPGCPVGHLPAVSGLVLGLGDQSVDADLELLVLPLLDHKKVGVSLTLDSLCGADFKNTSPVQKRAARYKGQTNLNMQSAFCFHLQAADRNDKGLNYLTGNRRSPDVEEYMCVKNGQELYLHLPSLSDKVRMRLVLQVLLLSLQRYNNSNHIASASWLSGVTRLRNATKHP